MFLISNRKFSLIVKNIKSNSFTFMTSARAVNGDQKRHDPECILRLHALLITIKTTERQQLFTEINSRLSCLFSVLCGLGKGNLKEIKKKKL